MDTQTFLKNVHAPLLQFRRVTIREAQPSARLAEEICLSEGLEGFLKASAGVSSRRLRGSAGTAGIGQGQEKKQET